jgi:hypothetical protein
MMKRGVFPFVAAFFFIILFSSTAWADDAASPVRLEYEDLGLGFCKIHIFYQDQNYGSFMKTSTSRDEIGGRMNVVTVYDDTLVPLQGMVDLSLVRKLCDGYTDMLMAGPISKILWGGLALVPGIPILALADYDDGVPYLGVALTAVGLVCSAVGGVWKLIYGIGHSQFVKYEPLVAEEIAEALQGSR